MDENEKLVRLQRAAKERAAKALDLDLGASRVVSQHVLHII